MPPIRLGIIGCGIAARDLHWPALKGLGKLFRITAVCNHTEPKARAFAELTGAPAIELDHRALLAREDVEAVAIILPIERNHDVATAALKAGRHVLLEKPLAASLAEGRRLVRTAQECACVAMVAENYRYRPVFRKVRDLLDAGAIGRVHTVQWTTLGNLTLENKYAKTAWRINHRYPGGFVMDAGVHTVNVIRMLFGEVESVFARSHSVNPQIGEVDTMMTQFRTERGVTGTWTCSFSCRGLSENHLLVLGEGGALSVRGEVVEVMPAKGRTRRIDVGGGGGYREQYVAWHAAIRGKSGTETPFAEGLRDFAVIAAALESSAKGRPVPPRG